MADLDEVSALLHVHEKAHNHGGLENIATAALNRLRQINAEHLSFAPAQMEAKAQPETEPGHFTDAEEDQTFAEEQHEEADHG